MRQARLAVLEVNWEEQILRREIARSVRPFFHGLEGELDVDFPEGEFNSKDDLVTGLQEFRRSRAKYLFVGSHGVRKMLFDTSHGITASTIIGACKNSRGKGFFFSACDFGNRNTAREFLVETKADFLAGYSRSVPWLESMLVDLFFLTYLLQGRVKRRRGAQGDVPSLVEDGSGFISEKSENPLKVARWVYEDVPLALPLGFDVYALKGGQGKKPRLICASKIWKARLANR
jgi:hypothetical protein